MALTIPTRRFRGRTHRLIASRWPTVGVFDGVAAPEDARAALVLESWTNDRVTAELDRLACIPERDWVVGQPGATLIMAAYCHPSPGGGRFNAESLGAWYAATALQTAVAETVYHHTRRLRHSAAGFRCTIQMRELISDLDGGFHDIRGQRDSRPDLYDPDDYARSQPFGEELRMNGSNGILYGSLRRPGGQNVVVFQPRLLPPILQGDHFDYRWTGEPTPQVVKLTTLG